MGRLDGGLQDGRRTTDRPNATSRGAPGPSLRTERRCVRSKSRPPEPGGPDVSAITNVEIYFLTTPAKPARLLARSLEQGLQFDGQAHVAFDLELARHEGGHSVHLAGHDLHEVSIGCDEGEVGGLRSVALSRLRFAFVDLYPPLS